MKHTIAAVTVFSLMLGASAMAAPSDTPPTPAPLSAQASNPGSMGWMHGFPPPVDKTIRYSANNDFFTFPKLRWTVCHFRELMPTVAVARGTQAMRALERAIDPAIDTLSFMPTGSNLAMTWHEAFDANYSDGVMVLHQGKIVYERYAGCLDRDGLHGAMSVTKSLTGLLAATLVAEGQLDPEAKVTTVVPELANSGFGNATVREVMDMTTGLHYSEDYSDPDADVWRYGAAASPMPKPEGYTGPRSYFEFLETVKPEGTHGQAFGYKTINADALGWIIARTTGKSIAQLLSERIWEKLGMRREGYYTVDSIGTPFAGGGFNATLGDMARLGQLMLDDGLLDGQQIIPAAAIADIRKGASPEKFAKAGYTGLKGWSYRNMWWIAHNANGAFAARGVHGQVIYIDPKADMVIVRFASHPQAANPANDPTSLPAYQAVADYLMAHTGTPTLVGREWVVEDIAGRGVIDDSHAALEFLLDGRLAGSASCNRLIGSYTLKGNALSVESTGTTKMACAPALMNQERTLLDLLPGISSYEIDGTGTLVLKTMDRKTITARRQ